MSHLGEWYEQLGHVPSTFDKDAAAPAAKEVAPNRTPDEPTSESANPEPDDSEAKPSKPDTASKDDATDQGPVTEEARAGVKHEDVAPVKNEARFKTMNSTDPASKDGGGVGKSPGTDEQRAGVKHEDIAPIKSEARFKTTSPIDCKDDILSPSVLTEADTILMSQGVFAEVLTEFETRVPEAAGVLLGPKNSCAVTHFLLDDTGDATPVSFTLDHAQLNKKLKPYLACGLDAKGVVHLHPRGIHSLSFGDLTYARKVFTNPKNNGLDRYLMPIVADGRMYAYVVTMGPLGLRVRPAKLVLF